MLSSATSCGSNLNDEPHQVVVRDYHTGKQHTTTISKIVQMQHVELWLDHMRDASNTSRS